MKRTIFGCLALGLLSLVRVSSAQSTPIESLYTSTYETGNSTLSSVTGTVTSILNGTSGTGSTNFVLSDGTGSVLAYRITSANYSPVVGQNITISNVEDSAYQLAPELVNTGLTPSSVTINSSGNSVTPPVISIPTFNSSDNASGAVAPYSEAIVTLEDVTLSNTGSLATNTTYTLTDSSGNTAALYGYKSDSAVAAAIANYDSTYSSGYPAAVDITGYADPFNPTAEIYPTSIVADTSSTPEPTSLCLLGAAALPVVARRRHRAC